jgi:hypothetical protein
MFSSAFYLHFVYIFFSKETAINIGRSCNLFKYGSRMIILETESLDQTRELINDNLAYIRSPNNNSRSVIIIFCFLIAIIFGNECFKMSIELENESHY